MKVAVISCGRSDYSIYLPILKKLKEDSFFELQIIAFGTHVSHFFGKTVEMFYKDGFNVAHEVESLILGDSPEAVSTGMGATIIKFSSIWARENYDLIMVLGDRFEMFSAIASSVPFNIPVAHLHGGETTLGAIDDKFRHCITSMSQFHFATTDGHAKRISEIIGSNKGVYNVGAPALDNLKDLNLLSIQEFKKLWGIDMSIPTVLFTFHPETVAIDQNIKYLREICKAMDALDYRFLITMPNHDTFGSSVRDEILNFTQSDPEKYKVVEVLGAMGYYSAMTHCEFLLGNTSSGIIEAASFKKYVINVGDRQKGRQSGSNVIHVPASKQNILSAVEHIKSQPELNAENIYGNGSAAEQILDILSNYFKTKK